MLTIIVDETHRFGHTYMDKRSLNWIITPKHEIFKKNSGNNIFEDVVLAEFPKQELCSDYIRLVWIIFETFGQLHCVLSRKNKVNYWVSNFFVNDIFRTD